MTWWLRRLHTCSALVYIGSDVFEDDEDDNDEDGDLDDDDDDDDDYFCTLLAYKVSGSLENLPRCCKIYQKGIVRSTITLHSRD